MERIVERIVKMRLGIVCIVILIATQTGFAIKPVVKVITDEVITVSPAKRQLHTLGWPNDIINSIALKTDEGIVLIDTQNSPANARTIKAEVTERFNDTTFVYIINTHGHSCHSGGNCIFNQDHIVAQENSINEIKNYDNLFLGQTVEYLRQRIYFKSNILDTINADGELSDSIKQAIDLYRFYEDDLMNNYQARYPDITFSDRKTLKAGKQTIELVYMGKGHGDADIAVYIPEEKVLCSGNLFHLGCSDDEGMPSFYANHENEIKKWISSMTYLLDKNHDFKYVLSTHGKKPLERENIEFVNEYCKKVYEIVHDLKSKNTPIEAAKNFDLVKDLFKEYKNVVAINSNTEEMHARNISIIWRFID